MKTLILLAMNTLLATALNAQGPLPMTTPSNWLAAHYETLGASTPANWLMDLDADGLEIHVTPEHALVLVDRAPIMTDADGNAFMRKGVHGLGGTKLNLVGEVESINGSVLRGVYSGLLGGTAVLMDQYVQLHNGVPMAIVRMITRVNGSAPVMNADQQAFVMALLEEPAEPSEPALTKQ